MSWRSVPDLTRRLEYYLPRFALDGIVAIVCYGVALILRFGGRINDYYFGWLPAVAPVIVFAYCSSALIFNLYRREWRYASLPDLSALTKSLALASTELLLADEVVFPRNHPLPLSVIPIGGALTFLGFGVTKFAPRLRRFLSSGMFPSGHVGVLIYGAGQTGQLLAWELLKNKEWDYQPVCFADDDISKRGVRIHGVPVRGSSKDIPRLIKEYGASVVAVAIPSATSAQMRAIVDICQPLPVRLLLVPGMQEMLGTGDRPRVMREMRIEDILGRDPVVVDLKACRSYLSGRTVLITGAAGSIGSELTRQVFYLDPEALVIVDNNESGLHDLALELTETARSTVVIPVVGSVTDRSKIEGVFGRWQPHVVFHAAAYKHVPLMEVYPEEAIAVNVVGTTVVSQAAHRHGVQRFVLVSTDKAVNPSNVMGATKRLAELLVKDMAVISDTRYCAVRFGNVLGSRGSVVPIFTRQIERGGPITVTDPGMVRYFMTIPEAASLIIQAGSIANRGDIFVLDMGEPIRIVELAEKMVRLRGLEIGKDIQLVYTGLRPGEKLAEILVTDAETVHPTNHPKVLRLSDESFVPDVMLAVSKLAALVGIGTADQMRTVLFDSIIGDPTTFCPHGAALGLPND